MFATSSIMSRAFPMARHAKSARTTLEPKRSIRELSKTRPASVLTPDSGNRSRAATAATDDARDDSRQARLASTENPRVR